MANKVLKSLTFPGLNDVYKIPQEADEYSTSATYAVGDYCIKDGVLYRCTTAITTAEAWTAGHWTATQLADEVTSQSEKIDDLKSAITTYNILPVAKQTASPIGWTTVYENGHITVKGTATGNGGRLVPVIGPMTLGAGTYTVSCTAGRSAWPAYIETGSSILASLTGTGAATATFTLDAETSVYFGVSGSSGDVIDIAYDIQLERGATANPILPPTLASTKDMALRLNVVTPEMYGAIGNGITPDGAAVQAALDSGKIVVASGIYNVYTETPYSTTFFLHIPDGAHIIGGTFKFPDNGFPSTAGVGRSMFIGDSFTIEGATFDMNGFNNLDDLDNKPMYSVYISNCKDVRILNCYFKNSAGRNYIYAYSGKNLVIENCTFKNGGTNLSGSNSTKQNDFSYVYTSAEDSRISKCTILPPDNDPFYYCGGFEIHNNNSVVSECQINKCLPGIYVARKEEDTSTNYNVKILNNTILNCQGGVSFFADHVLDNIEISGNYITLSPVTPVEAGMYGIGAGRNTLSNFRAVGNTLTQTEASEHGCTGISFGGATGVEVNYNILVNIPYPIYISDNVQNTDVEIEHNLIKASSSVANYAVTRQYTNVGIAKLTIVENDVTNYAGLLNDISAVTDYMVLDRLFNMAYLIERSKNLLPAGTYTATVQGIPTKYVNGAVNLNGTGTGSGGRLTAISPAFTLPAGKYTIKVTGTLALQYFVESGSSILAQGLIGNSVTFTLAAQTSAYIGINVSADEYVGDLFFELEKGETAGPFIPSGAYTAVDAVARAS